MERDGQIKKAADLWKAHAGYCTEELDLSLPNGFFEQLAEQGRLLLVVDGLDEVGSEERRTALVQAFARIAGRLPHGNRVVVTSRVEGYRRALLPQDDFGHFHVDKLHTTHVSCSLDP